MGKLCDETIEIVCEKCGGKAFTVQHIYWVFNGEQLEYYMFTCMACEHMQQGL